MQQEIYEKHILILLETEGFISKVEEFYRELNNWRKSYEATERMYKTYFGKNKYSGYESFMKVKNRKL